MSLFSFIAFYVPKDSFLHRLPVMAKLLLLLFYIITVFTIHSPLTVLGLYAFIVVATMLLGLPLRNRIFIFFTVALLVWITIVPPTETAVTHLIIAVGKLGNLMLIVGLFSMTTNPGTLLQGLRPSNPLRSTLQPIIYLFTTTLAALPGIQYDLQRALDAETLRRGRKVYIYSVRSWTTILIVVLVRVLTRAERLADTVIDRGYKPEIGLQSLTNHSLHWHDLGIFFVSLLPGLLVLVLR